jgi:hypothetical protein
MGNLPGSLQLLCCSMLAHWGPAMRAESRLTGSVTIPTRCARFRWSVNRIRPLSTSTSSTSIRPATKRTRQNHPAMEAGTSDLVDAVVEVPEKLSHRRYGRGQATDIYFTHLCGTTSAASPPRLREGHARSRPENTNFFLFFFRRRDDRCPSLIGILR